MDSDKEKKMKKAAGILLLSAWTVAAGLYGQMQGLHGVFRERKDGVHSGNQFRTTFYNDGMFGITNFNDPTLIGGEWPINSGYSYLIDASVLVGSEALCNDGIVRHIITEPVAIGDGTNSSGKIGPDGDPYTFLPLPGFSNPDTNKIAMSKWPWSWPSFWPDRNEDAVDPGWRGKWNGYFGKGVMNADEESYFVVDDYENREYPFYPDSTDLSRRGLGVRVYIRGFQWSQALVEDALFCLYDIENIGTTNHNKTVFGLKIGNIMGHVMNTAFGNESQDDNGGYDITADLAYSWDNDFIGTGGWGPVGYLGGAFLESPGNAFDGIDNDGDGAAGPGPALTEADFAPRTLNAGDDIVLIDYSNFGRSVVRMTADTLRVVWQDRTFSFWPGKEIVEEPFNGFDDNLNGLIDENTGVTIGTPPNEITTYLNVGARYIDYAAGGANANILLDERRDDGVDNDGDWDPRTDDVGMDGVARTHDAGEGDGRPTSGANTNLPGEPHIDKTDIDESDMLGLTSFYLYLYTALPLHKDEDVWTALTPGRLDDLMEAGDTELMFGSGYFPMAPRQVERFSMGLICGEDRDDLFENKRWVAKAYSENYNFSQAPVIPALRAVAGDRRVTLMWDDRAEFSEDPIAGRDFEGYRVYRSTDPGWNDMKAITDGQGVRTYTKPLAQFDLNNGVNGYAAVPVKGVHYWLGDDTGLVHAWTDTTVVNGQQYYYAVTSYDRGLAEQGIPPTECARYIAIGATGVLDKGTNVAVVRPEAPAAGFVPSGAGSAGWLAGSTTGGRIGIRIVDPQAVRPNTYRVTFTDRRVTVGTQKNLPATKDFTWVNVTTGETLAEADTSFHDGDEQPITDGFILSFHSSADVLGINNYATAWSRPGVYPPSVAPFSFQSMPVTLMAADFKVIFGEVGIDTSTSFYRGTAEIPAKPVNFTVRNALSGEKVRFAFRERDMVAGEDGKFTARTARTMSDEIILLDPDSLRASWQITLANSDTDTLQASAGDTLSLVFHRPFLSNDVFEFTMTPETVDADLAKKGLDDIRVVPNPYIAGNTWEAANPFASGRGPRELHFTHLPQNCRIRIFDISGQTVADIDHASELRDGTEIWDMRTRDNLDISYGVYLYHVQAPGIGEKIGKFAVIK